jgi:mycofactocin precursor peptide peptidase
MGGTVTAPPLAATGRRRLAGCELGGSAARRLGGWQAAPMVSLDRLTWPDLDGRSPLVVVPVGSTEQHGPHLPLGTDTLVAGELAARLARSLARAGVDAVVSAPVPFGSAGEHHGFAGTLSIGQAATELVLVELVRSAGWAAGAVLVNGHGGNVGPVRRAEVRLRAEGRPVLAWFPAVPGGDAHAGRTETSIVLALDPSLVRTDRAQPGNRRPLEDLLPELQRAGVAGVSPNGVLGDPSGASAGEGRQVLDELEADLVATVLAWYRSSCRMHP